MAIDDDASARLLLVAPLLGRHGRVPDVFETLGPLLADAGFATTMVSTAVHPARRSAEMVARTISTRRSTDVVVVHLYSGRAFAVEEAVAWLARLGCRRRLAVLAGGGLPDFARRHPRRVRRVLATFDHLVAPSAYLARWAEGVTRTPVTVVPNPLDLGPYPFRARRDVRPRLLWLRAYHDIYAPEVAVRALADLRTTHPAATLTMAGIDKGRREDVLRLAERLGVADAADIGGFAGPDEKARLFADHDVFLNTSRVDNRPVSVVEAAACGLCVVSSDVGGVPDLVEDGASALLVPPDEPVAVADAVRRLHADPALAARLSAGARAVAEAGAPDVVVAAWRRLLAGVDP